MRRVNTRAQMRHADGYATVTIAELPQAYFINETCGTDKFQQLMALT